ncbi:chromosome transmission fidelity protein 18 homolog, partial [Mercenaria mercenaria]|uniref:chromosome transmission fidelity protein 18 homolog n=1 Tax=Mercenaria mercenaria TaxID=6596 RepID=UPI00234E5F69
MDDFEEQYADELEALEDFDVPDRVSPNPRKSLQFTTPKNKQSVDSPVGSPMIPLTGSLLKNGDHRKLNGSSQKKRGREEQTQSDSDLEYEDDDLDVLVPASKKSRVDADQLDEDELWGDDLAPTQKVKAKGLHDSKVRKVTEVLQDVEAPPSPDRRAIERILEHRNKQTVRELSIDSQQGRVETRAEDYDFERPRVFKRIPTTSYLPTTGTEGNRVYMEVKDDIDYNKQFESFGKTLKGTSLLNVPISVLREQLEEERRNMLIAESQRISDEVRRQLEEDQGFMDDDEEEDKENHAPSLDEPQGPQKMLWVEKYTPNRYTDLLSEENINRSLLHWLKMWDYVVFDKELPIKPKEKKKEENKKFKKKNQPEVLEELDKHRRPLQKVALLCGPPGLGKTTLAHIIARHAGYNVVEMNASDDRTADVFKNKIESSTQMKAVLGADPRPNCLVIDEIDGAPQAAINVLLNVIKKSDTPEEGKKKKKEEGGILRRPIICICNDQYVPALRQLRQNSMILNFPQTEPTKLAGRLYE